MEEIVFLIWCMYTIIEGIRDASMYNIRDIMKSNDFNEHVIFTAQRGIVLLILAYMWWPILIIGPLAFSFLHNGTYYKTRNFLNVHIYRKGWWSQSTSSSALTTVFFNPYSRTILFILSIITLILIK